MSRLAIVMRRELVERVRSRAFLLSTLLMPLFMVAISVLPAVIAKQGGAHRKLVLVDEAPEPVGAELLARLTAKEREAGATVFEIRHERAPLAGAQEALRQQVLEGKLDGYLWLPADVLASNHVGYRAKNIANVSEQGELRRAASEVVQGVRIRQQGIDAARIAELLRRVELDTVKLTKTGDAGADPTSAFFFAYMVAFAIYMLVLLYGQNVMRSVLEEKTSRIAEVLMSSMRATHLLYGKILGVGAAALLQVAIWALVLTLLATQSHLIAQSLGIPTEAIKTAHVEPAIALVLVLFFLLGFFLYAAVFAAVGAAVSSEQEAQQASFLPIMLLIVPLLFIMPVISDPLGTTARVLGFIPFTSPVVMPMRLSATALPLGEVAGSLALLAATLLAVAWLAGKIYRIGMLSTGKKPSLSELLRWVRTP